MPQTKHPATLHRRRVLRLGGAALVAASPFAQLARAQSNAPVKLMVGFAAGGSTDNTARLVAEQLRAGLGRNVIVDNRAGAGGRLMLEQTKGAKPDGDTLVFVPHGAMTLFQHIYRNLRYSPDDYTPVGRVSISDFGLATGPATTAKTLAEYLTWARDPAHKAAFGSPGVGTAPNFLGELLAKRAKLSLTHVGYRGSAPAVVDVMGGALSLAIVPVADLLQHHQAGKLRILATLGAQRSSFLPQVPTLKESGIDLVSDAWFGLYAPAGTPPGLVNTMNEAVRKGMPAMAEPLARMGMVPAPSTPAELAQIAQAESTFWAKAVKETGFKPED